MRQLAERDPRLPLVPLLRLLDTACPDPAEIYQANILTLRALGHAGWAALREQCRIDGARPGDPGSAATIH